MLSSFAGLQNTKRKLNRDDISSSSWLWFKRNPNNPYKVDLYGLLHQVPKQRVALFR